MIAALESGGTSIEHGAAPVGPTVCSKEAPVEPRSAPMEPRAATVDPGEAPVEPGEAQVEPGASPIEPGTTTVGKGSSASEAPGALYGSRALVWLPACFADSRTLLYPG